MGYSVYVHSIFGVEIPIEDFPIVFKQIFGIELCMLTDGDIEKIFKRKISWVDLQNNWEGYLDSLDISNTPYKICLYEADTKYSRSIFIEVCKTQLKTYNTASRPARVIEPTPEQVASFKEFLDEKDLNYPFGNYLAAEGC